MPSEKQIEVAAKAIYANAKNTDARDIARIALTAAEQAEPVPAARSGAVKVVEDTYERYPKIMDRLAALEPAEPVADAEPVACVERGSAQSTPQPESRYRDALEEIANLKTVRDRPDDYNRGFADGRWQAVKIARAALAREDGR